MSTDTNTTLPTLPTRTIPKLESRLKRLENEYEMNMFGIISAFSDSIMEQADEILKDSERVNDPKYCGIIDHIFSMVETREDLDVMGVLLKHLAEHPVNNKAGIHLYKKFSNLDFLNKEDDINLFEEMHRVGNTDGIKQIMDF